MNQISIYMLKVLRKVYSKTFNSKTYYEPECENDPDKASQIIYNTLMSDNPCMITRFGANELECLVNYLGIKNKTKIASYLKGNSPPFWWSESMMNRMHNNAGFFPNDPQKFQQFSQLMINDIPEVNILGSWLSNERYFEKELKNIIKVKLLLFDPFWAINPWTSALKGKTVLVVHPFTETIEQQYKRKDLLFKTQILPEFELKTLKAVQNATQGRTNFIDWFDALEYMKSEIDKVNYDICLIGAGAYGFPLAAHVKRMGKKAFHLGGSLQLIFGIKGRRWEDPNYSKEYNYTELFNENWVKPSIDEKPTNADKIEDSCYW